MERLEGEGVFRCRRCRVDAASKDAIISRDFYGRTGRAYLFDHVYVLCRLPFSFLLARSRGDGCLPLAEMGWRPLAGRERECVCSCGICSSIPHRAGRVRPPRPM